jgi:RNA polymerase sigma factor (sigma-70 family)
VVDPEPLPHAPGSCWFEAFFRQHYASVVRVATGVLGDSHLGEDVAQDVFIAAQRRFSKPEQHAGAWVRVAAAHLSLNELRGRRRRQARQLRSGQAVEPTGPEELAIERAASQEVREALGRLPRRAATLLVLRHSGMSYAEVADALGVTTGQVGTMLRRAEARLRSEVTHATRR